MPREVRLRVLSLGAGVQSSTVLLMAARGELPRPDYAIFSDTGWEPQHVYDWLEWLESQVKGIIPVIRVSAGNIKEDSFQAKYGRRFATLPFYIRNQDGSMGRLRRQCTKEYKIEPINKVIRNLLGVAPGARVKGTVELTFGISTDEVYRVKDNRVPWLVNQYPLIDAGMDRAACLRWMEERGYPQPPKSSCIGCPYHDDAYWLDMRTNRPTEWEEACQYDEAIRNGLSKVLRDAYLHRSMVPLREAPLTTAEKVAVGGQTHLLDLIEQGDAFNEECEGMCGV